MDSPVTTAAPALSTSAPMPEPSRAHFSAVDYVLFIGMLIASVAVGVYYAVKTCRTTQTTKEVLLANKQLSILPVALTLSATFISAISILGYPAEIYQYGTMFCYYGLMYLISYPIAAYVFLPVFYRLDISSCYEYLELRFNRLVRIGASIVFTFEVLLYMAVVLYAPALALSSVTDLSMTASVLATGLVATFYTSIGGAKAVVWTNSMQLVLILAGQLAVVIGGSIEMGGISEIWSAAENGLRVQFSDFRADPTVRHSLWSLMIGGTFMILTLFSANQMSVQRYLSMPTLKSAQVAVLCNIPLNWIALIFYTLSGLIMYATYQNCDPRKAGLIQRADQLLPYFVMDKLGYAVGLPGLFVSAIYSAGLSTLSGGFNALTAVILTDFIKPAYAYKKKRAMADGTAAKVVKFVACALGFVCIALAFLFSLVQSTVLQIAFSIFGMAGGPLLGTFCLGMFVPWANWKGAFSGLVISVVCMFSLGISAIVLGIRAVSLPVGDAGCAASNTSFDTSLNFTLPDNFGRVVASKGTEGGIVELLKISYQYYSLLGVILVLVFGTLISAFTGFTDPVSVDPLLLIPVHRICCCLPKRWRAWFKCGVQCEQDVRKESARGDKIDVLLLSPKECAAPVESKESHRRETEHPERAHLSNSDEAKSID